VQCETWPRDSLAHYVAIHGGTGLTAEGGSARVAAPARREADQLIRSIFGEAIYRELEVAGLEDLWQQATTQTTTPLLAGMSSTTLREALPWVPRTLFATVNLPPLALPFTHNSR